jgi:hypothetical protein
MPRAASSAKRQQGANGSNHGNRDTRHENGLVGPGKRITKQKSQSQLDGCPGPALDNASVGHSSSGYNGSAEHHLEHQNGMAPENGFHRGGELLKRASLGNHTGSSASSTDSLAPRSFSSSSAATAAATTVGSASQASSAAPEEGLHRSINVNDAKNSNVHRDSGPLDLALTVLRSCPLHDTLAILIILMQVSPVALATIYMLFTFLTFVPPVTTSSGLSITEIFDGNQGTPSLTTLLCMDVVMLGIWLFLWAPMQQFILDLAQVVISLTLGGGGSSRDGATNNIFLCVAIVGMSQLRNHTQWTGLSSLNSIFGSRFFPSEPTDPLAPTVRAFDKKGPYGWVRSILAIHILTQGLVRYIREWYLRREKRDLLSQSQQQDPEAGKSSSIPGVESSSSDVVPVTTDTEPGTPLLPNSSSTGVVSNKKRRKQSAQVRIRQPLWAALASTKIVMVKEYELSHAASESAGSNATDIHNLGNAPFNTQPEQIWICYVGCDEVCFSTSHFPNSDESDDNIEDGSKLGIDTSKPFYVRVNHAVWQPTRIVAIDEEEDAMGTRWTGDIYGLTPFSNYECEFVSTSTGEVIFSTSVRTIQAKSKDPEATAKAPPTNPRNRHRHDSPATTLKASIAAAESKLADEKARLKMARKDNNRKLNSAKKEIEKLSSAVQSAGGNDDKLKQKVAQNNIQQKQTEQSITQVEDELRDLETIPEEVLSQHRAKQAAYTSEKAQYDGARASFKSFKTSIERELKGLAEEQATFQGKRNKIAARIAKVDSEHARITDANTRGLDEAERRRQERAAAETEAARMEHSFVDRISRSRVLNSEKESHIQSLAAQMQAYLTILQKAPNDFDPDATAVPGQYHPSPWNAPASTAFPSQQPMWPPTSMAQQLPSSSLAQTMAPLPAPSAAAFSPFINPLQPAISSATASPTVLAATASPGHSPAAAPSPQKYKARGRSSSMLSNVSGFTQSTDEDLESYNANANGHAHGNGKGIMHPGAAPPFSPTNPVHSSVHHAHHHVGIHAGSRPGFGFQRQRQRSDGGGSAASGSSGIGSGRSSLRSGSGSGGSLKDPTSPI